MDQTRDMSHIIIRPDWALAEKLVTSETVYQHRRAFLRKLGFAGALGIAGLAGANRTSLLAAETGAAPAAKGYPYPRNPEHAGTGWRLTAEEAATSYNNFYEFSTSKTRVKRLTGKFVISPWDIEIGGLVDRPLKTTADELIATMPMEERVYRFRCVEAWAMIVPWTGFQLSKLLEKVSPKAEAKFVKFSTFFRPDQAPGFVESPNYPWPYTEGLRLDEAMHPLAFVATGLYGKPMPKQNGAPIRLVVPWKYGYKSIKSIVKIELVAKQPATLWESLAPNEYPFESNVDPQVDHPRWSQATERLIDTGNRVNTLPYNGYANQVAKLYAKARS